MDPRAESADARRSDPAHEFRGVRVQLIVRALLAAFLVASVALVPPQQQLGACAVLVAAYVLWTAGLSVVTLRRRFQPPALTWTALGIDVAVLTIATVIAGRSDTVGWTADLLVNGFFLIPILAATQLRPSAGLVAGIPTLTVYLIASVAAKDANTEPWASIGVRAGALAIVMVACVGLSAVQRARVGAISGLLTDREKLAAQATLIEERERRELSEALHDGALQYVLAATQDLDDARTTGDATSFDRVDEALRESGRLLRSTMTQLYPAVLEQIGLTAALLDLAADVNRRSALIVTVSAGGWPARPTPADRLLFVCARELLSNVVKHAAASTASVKVSVHGPIGRLTVTDDGRGVVEADLKDRLAAGHIGLASRRIRIEAAGGVLRLERAGPRGTRATVELPLG